ncbi:MAG TPA: hemerythrin domain-containing protein [Kofleriaceae bacterium]
MRPIDLLMREHRLIEQVLDALTEYASRVERGAAPPADDLERFASWLRGYADAGHHAKEEDVLFVRMVASGIPRDHGPIGVMLEQHEEGRRLVEILLEAAGAGKAWSDAEARRVVRAANDDADLLREHIRAEDDVLYPLAQARVPDAAWDTIAQAFDELEAGRATERATLEALAQALIARYAPGPH